MGRIKNQAVTVTLCLAVLGLLLAGCGKQEAEVPLEGTYWVCVSYVADGELVDVLPASHMDIVFDDTELGGSSGCNRFNGPYTLDGNTLSIGPLLSTQMSCAEDLMVQEGAFLAALQSAAAFDIEGSTLKLLDDADGEVAVFEADMSPLTGGVWVCTGYNNGKQAVVSVAADTTITIEFSSDGTAKGSSGCNTYEAKYEIDDDGAMSLSHITVTERFCASPEGVMEQEEAFLSALETVASYEIRGREVTLRTKDGAAAATFMRLE